MGRSLGKLGSRLFIVMALLCSGAGAMAERHYKVMLADQDLGRVREQISQTDKQGYAIEQQSELSQSGWWGKFELSSELTETFDQNGVLLQASNRIIENGKVFWTKVELERDEYLAFRAQITSDEEKQNAEETQLAQGAIANMVPGVGEIMAVGGLLFGENDKNTQRRFAKGSFDTTLLGMPLFWKRGSLSLPQKLRVFDTEEMLLFDAQVSLIAVEDRIIKANETQVYHYRLTEDQGEELDIWLAQDAAAVPYFVKISGKDDGDLLVLSYLPDDEGQL